MKTLVSFMVLTLMIGFAGCETVPQTPQARMFATLQASAAGIESYRTSYETAYSAGKITLDQKKECDRRFNKANDAIIEAAEALRAGMSANTPENVDLFVRELVELVITIVPPKP